MAIFNLHKINLLFSLKTKLFSQLTFYSLFINFMVQYGKYQRKGGRENMTTYPFTYAVFYRSLIEPFTQLNQYDINHILFAGNINIEETHSDYISRVLGNGYVSGNKTIRNELAKRISLLTPQEIAPRIKMLGLQDLPLVLSTAKKLIQIADVSEQLQNQLLTKADTVGGELFIAELFQLSLRCHNQKLKLDAEHKKYLATLSTIDIQTQLPKDQENALHDASTPSNESISKTLDIADEELKAETDKLIEYYYKLYEEKKLDMEEKDYATWQKINLPADMDYFLRLIAPMLHESALISLDYADVITVSNIDFEHKCYHSGHIEILELSCPSYDLSLYSNALTQLKQCRKCLLYITGGMESSLYDITKIADILEEHLHPDAHFVYGARYDNTLINRYNLLLICHFDDSDKRAIISPEDIEDIINASLAANVNIKM